MNELGKICILVILLFLNILLWLFFIPREKELLANNLFCSQLENIDMYFVNHFNIKNSYLGADKFFKIDEERYLIDINNDKYCIVDLEAGFCIDSFEHKVRKTDKCIDNKCR